MANTTISNAATAKQAMKRTRHEMDAASPTQISSPASPSWIGDNRAVNEVHGQRSSSDENKSKRAKTSKTSRQSRKVILKKEVHRLQTIVNDMQSQVDAASSEIGELKDMVSLLCAPQSVEPVDEVPTLENLLAAP